VALNRLFMRNLMLLLLMEFWGNNVIWKQ